MAPGQGPAGESAPATDARATAPGVAAQPPAGPADRPGGVVVAPGGQRSAADPAPGGEPPTAPSVRRRHRPVLWTILGLLLTVVLVSGTAFVMWYHDATTPDRSAPDVVVDNYLRAFLVDRNDIRSKQYVCNRPMLTAFSDLRADIDMREKKYSADLSVSWGSLNVEKTGSGATVAVQLTLSALVEDYSQRESQPWRISVIQADGWRVCGAERVG